MKEKEANPTKLMSMVDGKPSREKTKVAETGVCNGCGEKRAREC